MSNLKISNSVFSFLERNKIKIGAIALSGVMALSISACSATANNENDTTNNSIVSPIDENKISNFNKTNIEKNIENISVSKDVDNSCYIITENTYLEVPYYDTKEDGSLFVVRTEKTDTGTIVYNISFEEAEKLKLTELLESKIITKTK